MWPQSRYRGRQRVYLQAMRSPTYLHEYRVYGPDLSLVSIRLALLFTFGHWRSSELRSLNAGGIPGSMRSNLRIGHVGCRITCTYACPPPTVEFSKRHMLVPYKVHELISARLKIEKREQQSAILDQHTEHRRQRQGGFFARCFGVARLRKRSIPWADNRIIPSWPAYLVHRVKTLC
jgi:hypothetical protein